MLFTFQQTLAITPAAPLHLTPQEVTMGSTDYTTKQRQARYRHNHPELCKMELPRALRNAIKNKAKTLGITPADLIYRCLDDSKPPLALTPAAPLCKTPVVPLCLTPAEQRVYDLTQRGLSAQQIAEQTGATKKTVANQRRSINAKLKGEVNNEQRSAGAF